MQAQDRPRFRQDLIAEVVEAEGARFIDVGAPDSDNVFRFYEVEYALACAMDGERDVAGIVKWAQEELGVTPSAKEIQSVISTLTDLRFIGPDKAAVAADARVAKAAPTQPEAKPAADNDLARGIVVGAKVAARAEPPVADVELGASGAKAQPKAAEIPSGADFDLGAPGAQAVAAPPRAPVEDIALGAPGAQAGAKSKAPASDIGMDLSAHMGVGTDDVKEAVRTSKAMTAVDVPKELLEAEAKQPAKAPEKQPEAKGGGKGKTEAEKKAQSERDKAAAAAKKAADADRAAADEKAAADKKAQSERDKAAAAEKKAAAAAAAAEKKPVEQKQPEKAAEKKPDKKPAVELPSKRPATEKPVAPPAPASGVSPVLVVMLILAIVGAGTFFVWKFVLSDSASGKQTKVEPPKPAPPPPPAVATSKLATETQAAQEIKAPVAGTIETIEPADKDIKAGDTVATLAGGKPLTNEITNLTKQIETAQPAIDAAAKDLEDAQQKPDNAAGVTTAQAKVDRLKKPQDERKAKLETKKADLDKLAIKATADGKLAEPVKIGQKVAVDEKIASIARPSLTVATFKVPAGTKMSADGSLSVVAGDKTLVCTVIDAQAETVKVSCPDDGLAAGTDVQFTLPK